MAAAIIPTCLLLLPVLVAAAFVIIRHFTWWPGRVNRRGEPYRQERS